MPAASRPRARPPGRLTGRFVAVAAAALALATLVGCTADDPAPADPSPRAEATDSGTPLSAYDTSEVALVRAGFCDRLAPDAVEEALGSSVRASRSWENGERERLAPGVHDVAHEFGCAFRGRGGVVAEAWVFTPPVTRARARDLAAGAAGARGCRTPPGSPAFGRPSVALVCPGPDGTSASYRGLFGDAWLTCLVRAGGPDSTLVDRAGRWCVAIVDAARA